MVVAASPVGAGPSGGALPPVLIEVLQVAGEYGIPADAEMVAANVTAVTPAENGFITVFPCDEDVPDTSNVNYFTDDIVPNLVLSRISAAGTICVYTTAISDVIVDVVGYVPAGSAITPLTNAARLTDTRIPNPAPIAAGTTIEVDITTPDEVPDTADLAMLNVTAIASDQPGFLRVAPCGTTPGETSSVNYLPGAIVPNLVITSVGTTGTVCIFTLAPANIVVDISAYATDGVTTLPTPRRIYDSRDLGPILPAGNTVTLDIAGLPDVPDTATAAVYNLTSDAATGPGFATSHPCQPQPPLVSNLNYLPGQPVANGTITALSPDGELCIYHLTPTHLIVDLIGYTTDTTHYVAINPQRIWDTREGWQPNCDLALISLGGGNYTLHDFEAGTAEPFGLPLRPVSDPRITMSADCTGVIYQARNDPATHDAVFVEALWDGSWSIVGTTESFHPAHLGLWALDDGTVLGYDGNFVTNIRTGVTTDAQWIRFITGFEPIEVILSRDGSTLLVMSPQDHPRRDPLLVTTWDWPTRSLLSGFEVSTDIIDVSISATGRYLAFSTDQRFMQRPGWAVITTLDGAAVDAVFDDEGDVLVWWQGDGRLKLIARSGIYSMELFGPISLVLEDRNGIAVLGGKVLSR